MFDLKRYNKYFEIADTTLTGYVWRCDFITVIALMGYRPSRRILNNVFLDLVVPTSIDSQLGIKIINSYRKKSKSAVSFINEEEHDFNLMPIEDMKHLNREVLLQNRYGSRTMKLSEFIIYSQYRAEVSRSDFYGLHEPIECDCEGSRRKERLFKECFIDDGSDVNSFLEQFDIE